MKTNHQNHKGAGTYLETTHGVFEDKDAQASQLIIIGNAGGEIESTNYFDLELARNGFMFLSWNASVARLLVPDCQHYFIAEMLTGKHCVITRGNLMGRDALEIMFDDGTKAPFTVNIQTHQCDRLIQNDNKPFTLATWTRSGKVAQWTANYRVVKKLPYMQPWK